MQGNAAMTTPKPIGTRQARSRTCVGCGICDGASALVRLVVGPADEVAFDLAGGSFGRGAYLHARESCLGKARGGLARSFRRQPWTNAAELGEKLVAACDVRMAGLLLAARRMQAVAIGAEAALGALRLDGPPALAIVAGDAGTIAGRDEVARAAAAGMAIVWNTRNGLGVLLGEQAVALCVVRHQAIAAELTKMRACADAGAMAMRKREGTECSRRPEAR